jgi:ATP-dependent DNA ligase
MLAGAKHLSSYTTNILEHGGEGVILRKYGSKYISGRSDVLIKLKVTFLSPFTPRSLSLFNILKNL